VDTTQQGLTWAAQGKAAEMSHAAVGIPPGKLPPPGTAPTILAAARGKSTNSLHHLRLFGLSPTIVP